MLQWMVLGLAVVGILMVSIDSSIVVYMYVYTFTSRVVVYLVHTCVHVTSRVVVYLVHTLCTCRFTGL